MWLDGIPLEVFTQAITADDERWVDAMMQLEHGFGPVEERPLRSAAVTFAAFVVVGFIHLLPFVSETVLSFRPAAPFAWSTVLTMGGFAAVGLIKGRVVGVLGGRPQ